MVNVVPLIFCHDKPELLDNTLSYVERMNYNPIYVHIDKKIEQYKEILSSKHPTVNFYCLEDIRWGNYNFTKTIADMYDIILENEQNVSHIWLLSGHCVIGPCNVNSWVKEGVSHFSDLNPGFKGLEPYLDSPPLTIKDTDPVHYHYTKYEDVPFTVKGFNNKDDCWKHSSWTICSAEACKTISEFCKVYGDWYITRMLTEESIPAIAIKNKNLPIDTEMDNHLYLEFGNGRHPRNWTVNTIDEIFQEMPLENISQARKINTIQAQQYWYSKAFPTS